MDEGMMDVDDSPDNVKGAPKAKPIPAPREGKKNAKDKEHRPTASEPGPTTLRPELGACRSQWGMTLCSKLTPWPTSTQRKMAAISDFFCRSRS